MRAMETRRIDGTTANLVLPMLIILLSKPSNCIELLKMNGIPISMNLLVFQNQERLNII